MTPELRGTLEKAADEAFQGMRAYHRSEIDHKRDAITVLTTVLAGNGGLVAAGFGGLENAAKIGWAPMLGVAVVVFLATAFLTIRIARETNAKIVADGDRYKEFKAQSIAAKTLLGLYAEITTEHGTETVLKPAQPGLGQAKTQRILDAFVLLVVIFSFVGWAALAVTWVAVAMAPVVGA